MESQTEGISRVRTRQMQRDQARLSKLAHKQKSVFRLFSWTLLGNVVYAACQLGMLVVLARMGSVKDVGLFSLALAISAPVFMLANLQLRGVIATDASKHHPTGAYISLRIVSSCMALLVVAGFAAVYLPDRTAALAIILMGAAKFFEAISDVLYGWWQQHEKMDWSGSSLMMRGIVSLVVFGGTYYYAGELATALAAYAGSWMLLLMLYDWPRAVRLKGFKWRSSPVQWWGLIKQCWPLGIVMMLVSLQANVPRYLIADAYGHEALGYYSALLYVTVAITTVVSSLGQSVSPRLSRAWAQHDEGTVKSVLNKSMYVISGMGVAAMIIIAVAGKWMLSLLYGSGYDAYYDLLILLVLGAVIGCVASLFGFALTAARVFKAQLIINAAGVGVTLAAQYLFIQLGMSLISAGYAMIIVSVTNMLFAYLIWNHRIRQWRLVQAEEKTVTLPLFMLGRERG
ncbi:oligosaccharide flippase family protein [Paenibacillus sp. ACRRX]|uniref:lipopolysaccharide biosynthesis protein n=1 Tax=Paenibacillus sp. ACRRX TaxID=2918206 RepID=UPI001EF6C53C|nr:oligosaccharide flippase family protein [Paenibacillus sp. ACRRX]MCG7408999.1 oligosaccharide flippase family protein [Paenibacillus sp. ACRRX]